MVRWAGVISSHVNGLKRSPTSFTSRGLGFGDCAGTAVTANKQATTKIERCIAPPIGNRLSAILFDHARSNSIVVFIDDNKPAGLAVSLVGITSHRLQSFNPDNTNVVCLKFLDGCFALK